MEAVFLDGNWNQDQESEEQWISIGSPQPEPEEAREEEKQRKKGIVPFWRRRRTLLTILTVLCFAASGVTWGYLAYHAAQDRSSAEDYAEAEHIARIPQVRPAPSLEPQETAPPDPQALALLETDLAGLRQVNPDVIGWITIPGTDLNYPLMFSGDNAFYLNHTWKGERNAGGSIFLEEHCTTELSDFNVIIYGHRMNNTTMFGTLKFYESVDFWREHPSVYIVSDEGVYRFDIFTAYEAGVRDQAYRLYIEDDEAKQEFIDYCMEHVTLPSDIVPTIEGKILTMSTCTAEGGPATRWVVQSSLEGFTPRAALDELAPESGQYSQNT